MPSQRGVTAATAVILCLGAMLLYAFPTLEYIRAVNPSTTATVFDSARNATGGEHELPSVQRGLMSTPNDLAEVAAPLSTMIDSLNDDENGRRPRRPEGGAAAGNLLVRSCQELDSVFTAANAKVLAKYEEDGGRKKREALPDEWFGAAPVCGIFQLYNRTKQMWLARGVGLYRAETFTEQFIKLTSCRGGGAAAATNEDDASGECADVYFAARLVGPTIVDVNVSGPFRTEGAGKKRSDDCFYLLRYTVFDAGVYQLEVQVSWYNGFGPEKSPPSHPVTLRKVHSKFGKKPHQKYSYNANCEAQTHIIGSPFTVVVSDAANQQQQQLLLPSLSSRKSLPLCRSGTERGRWLHHNNDFVCNQTTPYCDGDPSMLNDAKPFNEDFLWAPLRCKFRFWARGNGPDRQCVSKPGTMLLMGDSTTREYAQSLLLFDLRKTGLRVEYANWRIEHQWFTRKVARDSVMRLGRELQGSKPTVLVVNLGPLHLIGALPTAEWYYYVDQWEELFRDDGPSSEIANNKNQDAAAQSSSVRPRRFPFMERKVFLGPAAIHYATNDMTAQRMLLWMRYAQDRLVPLGFEMVDAWSITASRAEGSWDGVHYAAERGKAQMKHMRRRRPVYKWNGGVSIMLATVLLNLLCNGNATSAVAV